MPKAIFQLPDGPTAARALLGMRGERRGSVRQVVHDGDTLSVQAEGDLGVRLLGVDAPERSFPLPGEVAFRSLGAPAWEELLSDPFAAALPPFEPGLSTSLQAHLRGHTGPGVAANHDGHARAAEQVLEKLIEVDAAELGVETDELRFFLLFAFEVMDRYGRLLCYVNRNQPAGARPPTLNERLLRAGRASPYFIWPNVNPFRRQPRVVDAVFGPGLAATLAEGDEALRRARGWVREARKAGLGIYAPDASLRLEPWELRFLARRRPPDRWLIDLRADDDVLLEPQAYYEVPYAEDRLFIPPEYVPLFVEAGWRRRR